MWPRPSGRPRREIKTTSTPVPPPPVPLFATFALRDPEGIGHCRSLACAMLNQEWARRGLPPVLSLTPEHRARGEATLREMGVPQGAWHACLHVRSPSFLDKGTENHNAPRNAPIESYLPAMRHIVAAGGWVMRMGDPGMPPLEPMAGVVDYAHSRWKSDWMDVFLCGSAAFFVATQSGLLAVSQAFGVPTAMTNILPVNLYAFGTEDRYIPRKVHSTAENRLLSFAETFRPPFVNTEIDLAFEGLALKPLHHTADEIRDLVDEMIDRHLGRAVYSEADRDLQQSFVETVDYHGYGQTGRVGRQFLRNHTHLLERPHG